MSRSYDTVFVL